MASTPNYLWPTPDDTDPVGDGALDMRTLANAIDASLLSNPNAGLRNRLINGSMEFWQRGTTAVTTSGTYYADRWLTFGNATISATRANVTPNAVTPGQIRYATQFTVTSLGTSGSNAGIIQKMESAGTLAGKTVTVSFYAYASVANLEIACSLYRFFGSGGSPSTAEELYAYTARKTSSLSTSAWNRYSFSFNVPTMAGKTLGLAGNDSLSVYLWFDAGSAYNTATGSLGNQTGTFYVTGVQVEQGPGASDFEERPRQTELALCQRYYEKTYRLDTVPGTNTNVGLQSNSVSSYDAGNAAFTAIFQVPKRNNVPSMTAYTTTGTSGSWDYWRNGVATTSAVTFSQISERSATLNLLVGLAWAPVLIYGHFVASNEL